jgi:hypothetical protein
MRLMTTTTGLRLAACLALAFAFFSSTGARADDAPADDPAPPAITPVAPVQAPPPATGSTYEAADTAPAAGAPLPAAQPQALTAGGPPARRPQPFYREPWFWGGMAAFFLTAAIVASLTLGSSEAPTPQTTLGDMHAF